MANNIIFLGTGGDSYVVGKQLRGSGGIILQINNLQFHIDPGPGALVRAVENNINIRANTAVIATNASLLHSNDINAVIDAMTYGGTDKNGLLVANNTLINGTEQIPPYLTDFHKSCVERIITMDKNQKMAIEDVEIHALPAQSSDPDGMGLKFLAPDFTLVYTSDTGYSKNIIKEYKGADILIINTPSPGEEKTEDQLNSETAAKIISEVKPKLAIISHFGIKMLKADPIYEGREIQKKTGVQVLVAKEGMTISPGSYAANSTQKRLNTYKEESTGEIKVEDPMPKDISKKKEEYDHQEHLEFTQED